MTLGLIHVSFCVVSSPNRLVLYCCVLCCGKPVNVLSTVSICNWFVVSHCLK